MPWTQKQHTEYRKKWLAHQTPEKQEQMREENKARCKKWYAEHPEQAAKAGENSRRYYYQHREEVLAKQREYYREKHPKK